MMERAPTRPRERASEDLTIVMMSIVVMERGRKLRPNCSLFDRVVPNFA